MKTEVLLRSIGKINDELIADAESEANTKRKPGWARLGTMAACLALGSLHRHCHTCHPKQCDSRHLHNGCQPQRGIYDCQKRDR